MLFRFVRPNPNGSVTDIPIAAPDLQDAFDQFKSGHWYPGSAEPLGIWCGERLAGHVLIGPAGPVLAAPMEPERIRETITATVDDWLRDYGIPPGKEHRQLVNRIVAAVLAMQQAMQEPPPRSLACGD